MADPDAMAVFARFRDLRASGRSKGDKMKTSFPSLRAAKTALVSGIAATALTGARAEGALRFSLCPFNTTEEMDAAATALAEQVLFLRRFQRR